MLAAPDVRSAHHCRATPTPRSRSGWRACVRRRALCRPDAVAARSPPRPVRPRDIPRRPVARRPDARRPVAEQAVRRIAGRRAAGRCAAGRFAGRVAANRAAGAPERRSALCRLASIKQLAAELRRRPIAAVLVGICRDLGITPHHPLRQEMSEAITAYGGSVEALEQDADQRWCSKRWLEIPFTPPPFSAVKLWPAPWSHPVTAAEAIWPP